MRSVIISMAIALCFATSTLACDDLPILVILDKSTNQQIFAADSAMYDAKLGQWLFYDKVQKKHLYAAPDRVLVAAISGEYQIKNRHVYYVSSNSHASIQLPYDGLGFQQTTIDEATDNTLQEL